MSKHLSASLRKPGSQILLGLLLAMALVAVIDASTTYDEECGWSWGRPSGWQIDSYRGPDGLRKVQIGHGLCRLQARLQGEIEFAADEREVERLGPGAFLEIEERSKGERRRLEVRRDAGGRPRYTWFVDRRRSEFDDAARDWLRKVLPRLYRTTGLDADGRLERLLATEGLDGVLREIDRIPGDGVQGLYLRKLVAREDLGAGALEEILHLAGREVSSDYELARVLSGIPAARLETAELRDAYVAAARTLGSDFELRRALTALAESGELDAATTEALLDAALTIGSDYELATLLVTVAEKLPGHLDLPPRHAEALLHLGSDSEHRRALVAALDRTLSRAGATGESLEPLLRTADRIGSDYELAEVLAYLAGAWPPGRPLPPSYFDLARGIGSDYELRRTLSAAIRRSELTEDGIRRVLDASLSIGSDFEQAELLVQLLATHTIPETLRPEVDRAVAGVGSQVYRDRVRAALPGEPTSPADSSAP